MLKNQNIFITGATGFIGKHLALELAKDNNVVALVRGPRHDHKDKELLSSGIRVVWGNLLDNNVRCQELEKADYVFHLAALFKINGKKKELYKVNVLGTKTLLEACKGTKIKRFVYCSTAYVLAGEKERENIAEEEPCPAHYRNWYEWSKAETEKLILSYYKDHNIPVTIIRPSIVYGPGGTHAWYIAFYACAHKTLTLSNRGRNKIHFISVHDVVRAAICLAEKDEATGQIFNICDEHPYSQREAVLMMRKAMGIKGYLFSIPKSVFRLVHFLPIITRLTGGATPTIADYYIDSYTFSNQKLKSTGFTYQYPDFKDGLEETVHWYADNKILPIKV